MAADVYSLGKILYWLLTGDVYDGHEEDYSNHASRHLAQRFPSNPQFAFVDELVAATVRRNAAERPPNAGSFLEQVRETVDRIEAGGRVLDLRIPQRCLYCAVGRYHPGHDRFQADFPLPNYPDLERRRKPQQDNTLQQVDIYANLKKAASGIVGTHGRGAPLFLVCDYCGNVQFFRLDYTRDGYGGKWRP